MQARLANGHIKNFRVFDPLTGFLFQDVILSTQDMADLMKPGGMEWFETTLMTRFAPGDRDTTNQRNIQWRTKEPATEENRVVDVVYAPKELVIQCGVMLIEHEDCRDGFGVSVFVDGEDIYKTTDYKTVDVSPFIEGEEVSVTIASIPRSKQRQESLEDCVKAGTQTFRTPKYIRVEPTVSK